MFCFRSHIAPTLNFSSIDSSYGKKKLGNKIRIHMEQLLEGMLTSQEIFDSEYALDDPLLFSEPLIADLYLVNMN